MEVQTFHQDFLIALDKGCPTAALGTPAVACPTAERQGSVHCLRSPYSEGSACYGGSWGAVVHALLVLLVQGQGRHCWGCPGAGPCVTGIACRERGVPYTAATH